MRDPRALLVLLVVSCGSSLDPAPAARDAGASEEVTVAPRGPPAEAEDPIRFAALQWVEEMRGFDMRPRRPRGDGRPEPEGQRRERIVLGLRSEGEHTVRALAEALADPQPAQRTNAARMLTELGGSWAGEPMDITAARDALRSATRDPVPSVRSFAAHALANLGEGAAPALEELVHLLEDPDPAPRNTCCMALTAIGPGAAPALPALRLVLEEAEDETFRRFVRRAIESIERR